MKKIGLTVLLVLALLLPRTDTRAGVNCTLPFTLQNGTVADATQVMANYNALTACLLTAAAAGANSDITSLLGLTTPLSYTLGGTNVYIGGTSTGSANAQVVASTTPIGFSLVAGKSVFFIAGATNTGPATLATGGTTATNIFHVTPGGLEALSGGEIHTGNLVWAVYDGTQYDLLYVSNQLGGGGPSTSIASATTTDLAAAVNHNALITGAVTITGFGSNADTNFPFYRLTFNGALTLTNNAASLILPGGANITTQQNDTAVAAYLGSGNWQVVSYAPVSGASVIAATPLCSAIGLTISNNTTTPNTNIDIAADQMLLVNSSGVTKTFTSPSFTINTTNGSGTSAANGMDGESRPASTWVHLYGISDGNTVAGLASLSATAPTMPTGYTYKCRYGAMFPDGSTNFYRSKQVGNDFRWWLNGGANTPNLPKIAAGPQGNASTPTYISTLVRGATTQWAPPTATHVVLVPSAQGGDTFILAPNSFYGNNSTTTNPPPCSGGGATNEITTYVCDLVLETNAVFFAVGGSGNLWSQGYKDKVNAQ